MKTIWKYILQVTDVQTLSMPKDAKVLTAKTQHGVPCIWVEVDPKASREDRIFQIIGTGHPISSNPSHYLGTFQIHGGDLVFHIYEGKTSAQK